MIELYHNSIIKVIKHGKLIQYKISNDRIFHITEVFSKETIKQYSLPDVVYDFRDSIYLELVDTNENIIFEIIRGMGYNNIVTISKEIHEHLADIDCVIKGTTVGFKYQKDMERIKIIKKLVVN